MPTRKNGSTEIIPDPGAAGDVPAASEATWRALPGCLNRRVM
ncbi:hypothetical protein [Nonomuraea sp. NPDC049784]